RLYRHRTGAGHSEQHTLMTVGEGGLLEYLPDPLIPFAGSRHVQRTSVTLENRASFFGWDVLAPGRQAMGEVFAFDSLRVETSLQTAAHPLLLESFLLEPHARPMRSDA